MPRISYDPTPGPGDPTPDQLRSTLRTCDCGGLYVGPFRGAPGLCDACQRASAARVAAEMRRAHPQGPQPERRFTDGLLVGLALAALGVVLTLTVYALRYA